MKYFIKQVFILAIVLTLSICALAQQIELTYPNGGEQWEIGVSNPTITWNHSGDFDTFDLWLSRDDGSTWEFLDKGLLSQAVDWTWNECAGGPPSTNCLVKVVGHYGGGDISDVSDNVFQIVGDHWIEVTYPNGGEEWYIDLGDTTTIRWTHSGNFDSFDLLLSRDRGIVNTYDTLDTGLLPDADDWCFNSLVPPPTSTECVVKIIGHFGNDNAYDRSDDYFSIDVYDGVVDEINLLTSPAQFTLNPASPNPFNNSAKITFSLKKSCRISLIVYDVQGREIANLVEGLKHAGEYETSFDASNLASGLYLARLTAGDFTQTQKLLLVK